MNVVLKNGKTKKYRLTLTMVGAVRSKWHYVDYQHIIDCLEKIYPELKNNIDRAYL